VSDSFQRANGRKLVSRATAQEVGAIAHLLVDTARPAVVALITGKGKKAQLVDWGSVTGFGPDAVIVTDDQVLREPADDRERLAASGGLDLLGKRILSERGNELGTIDDVSFNPSTGVLEVLRIGDVDIPADSLLGSGSYAVVVSAREAED
jgi:sporulation protein YlmC with PRC-barrel domain